MNRLFQMGGPEFRHLSYRSRNSVGITLDEMSRWTVGGETSDRNSDPVHLSVGKRAICDEATTWRMLVTPDSFSPRQTTEARHDSHTCIESPDRQQPC